MTNKDQGQDQGSSKGERRNQKDFFTEIIMGILQNDRANSRSLPG
jgi:hypothetical protein